MKESRAMFKAIRDGVKVENTDLTKFLNPSSAIQAKTELSNKRNPLCVISVELNESLLKDIDYSWEYGGCYSGTGRIFKANPDKVKAHPNN